MQSGGGYGPDEDLTSMAGDLLINAFDFFVTVLIFLVVMATAGLVPTLLERGRAEFYIARPYGRRSLLLGKFFAIWVVYGAAMTICSLFVWLVGGVAFGSFSFSALWVLVMALVALFIWLSVTVFVGIWSGSTAMAVMSAVIVWVLQTILAQREWIKLLTDSKLALTLNDWFYYIVPKPSAIADIAVTLASGQAVDDWLPLWSSLLFAVVVLGLAVVVFKRKDY
jgi:ABC-type transport system involved in multi-copper enzyme maturation permease subunit